MREARFGYDHSDTLKSRGNLARAYVEQPDVMAGIEKGTRDHQQPERDPVAFPEVLCDGLVGGGVIRRIFISGVQWWSCAAGLIHLDRGGCYNCCNQKITQGTDPCRTTVRARSRDGSPA